MSAHDALFFSRNRPFVPVVPERNRKREPTAPSAIRIRNYEARPGAAVSARRSAEGFGTARIRADFPPPDMAPCIETPRIWGC
jgi:hypothetical protein